jgi:L-lactate dehydrogenase complex protein LldG
MIERFVDELHTNSCVVHGPMEAYVARGVIVDRARSAGATVACNDDVGIPALLQGLRAAAIDVLTPDDASWSARLTDAAVGITGARIAVADPAAIGLVAAPGSPRATSLVPHVHLCVVRVADVVPTLTDALARVVDDGMPSALTWIGGPSRTGDLEMILTLGVHGPRTVEVVLIDEG